MMSVLDRIDKSRLPEVCCAECGALMRLMLTKRFQYPNGDDRLFYGCKNYPRCKGTHGAHPDGRPVGVPARAETKAMRRKAHDLFDEWVKMKGWNKHEGYAELEDVFRTPIHIGELDLAGCEDLIAYLRANI